MDLRPSFDAALEAFGIDVTVTRPFPGEAPIATRGLWLQELTEAQPFGTDFNRRDPRRVLAVSRTNLRSCDRGTVIQAAEEDGGVVKPWLVDELLQTEVDCWRVAVRPAN